MPRRWSGVIAREGVQTGDGRVIADGACYWEGLPLPFRWDQEDDGGHAGAVVIGNVETVERRDGGEIFATGIIDDAEGSAGAEAIRLMEAGILGGVSIDPDDWALMVIDTTVTEADLAEAEAEMMAMFASVRERAAVVAAAGDPDPGPDAGVVIYEDEAGSVLERYTRLRIRGATLCDIQAEIGAAITLDEAPTAEGEPPTETDNDAEPVAASGDAPGAGGCGCGGTCGCGLRPATVVASAAARPPAAAFTDPALAELTPLTVDGDRVYGHIAGWSTCHTGSPSGACVTAPRSAANYAYFRTGVVETDQGDVPVGQLTLGGGHADLSLSYRGAAEHYDDVATAVADVTAGEDAHGIWVAGVLRPGVTDDQVAELRAASPSGDWRNVAGNLELVAVHAVNVPGFPVARVASGRPAALVAAGVVQRTDGARLVDGIAAAVDAAVPAVVAAAEQAVARVLDEREARPLRRDLAAIGDEHRRGRTAVARAALQAVGSARK